MFALRLSDTVPRDWYRAERDRTERAEALMGERVSTAYDDAMSAAASAVWGLIYRLTQEEAHALLSRIAEEQLGASAARHLATATNPHMMLHDYVMTQAKEAL